MVLIRSPKAWRACRVAGAALLEGSAILSVYIWWTDSTPPFWVLQMLIGCSLVLTAAFLFSFGATFRRRMPRDPLGTLRQIRVANRLTPRWVKLFGLAMMGYTVFVIVHLLIAKGGLERRSQVDHTITSAEWLFITCVSACFGLFHYTAFRYLVPNRKQIIDASFGKVEDVAGNEAGAAAAGGELRNQGVD